ncbi:MAG TPA: DinB family protein [Candidatus Limnocylindrales bacterium]
MTEWLAALEPDAPDTVAAYRGIEADRFVTVRREVRRHAGPGSADRLVRELAALSTALTEIVARLPEAAFAAPGGEEDWTVAQAIGHAAAAREGLAYAAALAASGRWPADAGRVIPGVPGPADASRERLLAGIARSQKIVVRAARSIAGHETDPCPLDHPLVGRLRCGEWLLFAGVHDLMHLEQLHRLEAGIGPAVVAGSRSA